MKSLLFLFTSFFCILTFAQSNDVSKFVELMTSLNEFRMIGNLEIKETIGEVEVELSAKNKAISGRDCLVSFYRFEADKFFSSETYQKLGYMTNAIFMQYDLKGEFDQFPMRFGEKLFGHHHRYNSVSVNESDGSTVIGKYDSYHSKAWFTDQSDGIYEVKTLNIENTADLDWGPKSLILFMQIKLKDVYPTETALSLIVSPEIRKNPPSGYTLPNDIHYKCKHAWIGS